MLTPPVLSTDTLQRSITSELLESASAPENIIPYDPTELETFNEVFAKSTYTPVKSPLTRKPTADPVLATVTALPTTNMYSMLI
mmetsp:Transcript_32523/g.100656  ORF Transcript_32523/g.100656 Transcript_32523/m.100656 type:complete len:84 (+) Transcript_32523:1238-1489(+)